MKLISNFKDYYDYLIGTHGIDEKAVYERVCSTEGSDSKWHKSGIYRPDFLDGLTNYESWSISFCGAVYYGHYYNGKYFYGKEAKEHIPSRIPDGLSYKVRGCCEDSVIVSEANSKWPYWLEDFNEKYNCPAILSIRNVRGNLIQNPKLVDFGFNRVVTPDEAYIKIINFILREKPVLNNQTDIEKIEAHGFDKKTSFRNM